MKIFGKTSRWFKVAVAALLLASVWIFGAWGLAERLIVQKPLESADVIVVLGGSAVYKERTQKAAELYHAGVSGKIILTNDGLPSGWSKAEQRNPYFIERAKNELISLGVPAENIEMLPQIVESTKDEAVLIGDEAQKRGWQKVLIVTSAYHSRRALWLFELYAKKGDTEFGITSPLPGTQTPATFYWWLLPKGWNFVAGEYVKSAYYLFF